MIVRAWRLVREKRAADAFTGEGARLYGGRWNPPGLRATYLSAARSLAALEVLVHEAERVPSGRFLFFEVRFAEALIEEVSVDLLDADWRSYPPRKSTIEIGRRWIQSGTSAVLRVPSQMIPEESNYIVNPEHPRSEEVEIQDPQPFTFGPRMRAKPGLPLIPSQPPR